jgi:hypothetical protein
MSYRTVSLSTFEEYLQSEGGSPEVRAQEERDREDRLSRFPYPVTLKVSFAELDFTNRLLWQRFGPAEGECRQRQSEYRVCDIAEPHSHAGKWMFCWLAKTEYNYGFCEWCFAERSDQQYLLAELNEINWGEKHPE